MTLQYGVIRRKAIIRAEKERFVEVPWLVQVAFAGPLHDVSR